MNENRTKQIIVYAILMFSGFRIDVKSLISSIEVSILTSLAMVLSMITREVRFTVEKELSVENGCRNPENLPILVSQTNCSP